MADKMTIARPYAKAAFEAARQLQHLSSWSQSLRTAAIVVQDPQVQDLLGNPSVTAARLAQFINELAGEKLDETGRNFVRTLAENHRLAYLPEISTLFETMKDESEGVIDVTVISAAPLQATQQQTLASALQRRLKREVRLHCQTDAALIGGAVLRAGDLVIDGSLRARLDRIAYELTA